MKKDRTLPAKSRAEKAEQAWTWREMRADGWTPPPADPAPAPVRQWPGTVSREADTRKRQREGRELRPMRFFGRDHDERERDR
ncbi:hypothetical protein [Siccirubricoccus phaeus]|uniref:hypothetical protein n=1 Tax=Siccirubricoccus phaeus TaxID=2595053 RepID=UPI0011F3E5F9|nr:hypothetical protein [Siccirubricoccus phaeus]